MIITGAARLMRVLRRKEGEADEGQLSYLGDRRFGGGGDGWMRERRGGVIVAAWVLELNSQRLLLPVASLRPQQSR